MKVRKLFTTRLIIWYGISLNSNIVIMFIFNRNQQKIQTLNLFTVTRTERARTTNWQSIFESHSTGISLDGHLFIQLSFLSIIVTEFWMLIHSLYTYSILICTCSVIVRMEILLIKPYFSHSIKDFVLMFLLTFHWELPTIITIKPRRVTKPELFNISSNSAVFSMLLEQILMFYYANDYQYWLWRMLIN